MNVITESKRFDFIYIACDIEKHKAEEDARVFSKYKPGNEQFSKIKSKTTTGEFDRLFNSIQNCDLKGGSKLGTTAMSLAAEYGNTSLIQHIWNIGGSDRLALLELGTNMSYPSPLFHAVCGCRTKAARKLIQLGANINVTARILPLSLSTILTPLDYALQRDHLPLIRLLVLNGGRAHQKLLPEHKEGICKAVKRDSERFKLLSLGSIDKNSPLFSLPIDIIRLLFDTYRLLG